MNKTSPQPVSLEDLSRLGIDERNRLYGDGKPIQDAIDQIGAVDPKDVQGNAASQLRFLSAYHQIALTQSARSFFWALIGSGIGLAFFVVAVSFALVRGMSMAAVVPLLSGAVINVLSAVCFYIYAKATEQLNGFHSRLEVWQRYLLANSLCESLDTGEERNRVRAALIQEVFRPEAIGSSVRKS